MKKHTTYRGFRESGTPVIRRSPLGEKLTLGRSRVLRDHATAFEWGYQGQKPKQLALAILLDWSVDESLAIELRNKFEEDVIAALGRHKWVLGPNKIQEFVDSSKAPSVGTTPPQQEESVP